MNTENIAKHLRVLWRTDRIIADIRLRHMLIGLGMRAFSGITVGLFGAAIGIHWSLGLSAAVLMALLITLFRRASRAGPPAGAT